METTIVYWGIYGDNGKENGNYYNGLYRGYIGLYRVIQGYIYICRDRDM